MMRADSEKDEEPGELSPGKKLRLENEALKRERDEALKRENQALRENEELKKRERERQREEPKRSVIDAMRARLREIEFPSNVSAYDLPFLTLPEDNPCRDAVLKKQVVVDLFDKTSPDFLLTRLDQPIVQLTEFRWDKTERRLSRGSYEPNKALLHLGEENASDMIALVSASGSGKTRYLMEQGAKYFCIYLVARSRTGLHGVNDLASYLNQVPRNVSTPSDVDAARTKLVDVISRVILARLAVLERIRECTPDLKPIHWLMVQLFPGKFTGGRDVFAEALQAAKDVDLTSLDLMVEWGRTRQKISFIAIDEAQHADQILPNTFQSTPASPKRSALAVLVSALEIEANIIVSGTGLGITSAMELLISNAAKKKVTVKLVGTTTLFNEKSLQVALEDRGCSRNVDKDLLKLFSGRPRFGMRLAEALLLGKDPNSVIAEILNGFKENFDRLRIQPFGGKSQATKTIYSELRLAAIRWILHGEGSVLHGGDSALELGVCALDTSAKSKGTGSSTFVIKEPLVVRAFSNLPDMEFEHISNEPAELIGKLFEDYIALHAKDLLDGVLRISEKVLDKNFVGPWKIAEPTGDQLIGISSKDGEEPVDIRRVLECAGLKGQSVVFPGTSLGADLVIAGLRNDGRKLLVFVQVKACKSYSTEAALNSLRYPYHQNRDKTIKKVPGDKQESLRQLEEILYDESISVIYVVVKFPANSQWAFKRSTTESLKAKAPYNEKKILRVVFDGSNARQFLAPLAKGLEALNTLKSFPKYS